MYCKYGHHVDKRMRYQVKANEIRISETTFLHFYDRVLLILLEFLCIQLIIFYLEMIYHTLSTNRHLYSYLTNMQLNFWLQKMP
jgi:hypothetical protein